ncbi:MAG: hypothetical protein WAK89_14890 [Candidatus Sulfotelmatobacter sp.]
MACMTLLAPPAAMATKQLTRVINHEASAPQQEQNTDRRTLRMNWVVVTGEKQQRVLRMHRAKAEYC